MMKSNRLHYVNSKGVQMLDLRDSLEGYADLIKSSLFYISVLPMPLQEHFRNADRHSILDLCQSSKW